MCKKTPDILYKYKSVTKEDRDELNPLGYTRKMLVNGEIYFSKFSQLNDPNEAIFSYDQDTEIIIEPSEESLYPNIQNKQPLEDGRLLLLVDGATAGLHVRKRLDERWGIFCLTEDPKNLLMYDYYANGHKGICIGFDWKMFTPLWHSTKKLQIPQKIRYSNDPLIKSPSQSKKGNTPKQITTVKSTSYRFRVVFILCYLLL